MLVQQARQGSEKVIRKRHPFLMPNMVQKHKVIGMDPSEVALHSNILHYGIKHKTPNFFNVRCIIIPPDTLPNLALSLSLHGKSFTALLETFRSLKKLRLVWGILVTIEMRPASSLNLTPWILKVPFFQF